MSKRSPCNMFRSVRAAKQSLGITHSPRGNAQQPTGAATPALHHSKTAPTPSIDENKQPIPVPARVQARQMIGEHKRNTGPMLTSPHCGAKTRSGKPCRSPAVNGKRRCRMHGGAEGSGAPRGNKNALKHGRYTREAIEERRSLQGLVRQSRKLLFDIE